MLFAGNREALNAEEGYRTQTSKEQTAVEIVVGKCFDCFDHSRESAPRKLGLFRTAHIIFLLSGIRNLSSSYQCLDSSRPWLIYWTLNSFALLEYEVEKSLQDDIIDFLVRCRSPSGGFGGGPGQYPHLATTYAAVNSLALIGTTKAFEAINRITLLQFISSVHNPDGSFSMHVHGEIDVRGAYCAIAVAKLVAVTTQEMELLFSGTAEWIASCQTYEGGIGGAPGLEAHGGYTFCGVAASLLLEDTDRLRADDLLQWTASRQMRFEGGFQGRTNKLVDGCYSFWQAAIFPLVQSMMYRPGSSKFLRESLSNGSALIEYILVCCQDVKGGLRDKPGKPVDVYHTCYTLSGLAIAQHSINEHYTVNGDMAEHQLQPTNPLFNISYPAVSKIMAYFQGPPEEYSIRLKYMYGSPKTTLENVTDDETETKITITTGANVGE